MKDFKTSETIFGIIEVIAWVAIIVGIILAFKGASAAGSTGFGRNSGAQFAAAIPGIFVTFFGIFLVAFTQVFRAVVTVAQTNADLLVVSKEQLRIAKAQYDGTGVASASFANSGAAIYAAGPSSEKPNPSSAESSVASNLSPNPSHAQATFEGVGSDDVISYGGKTIRRIDEGFAIGELRFKELEPAKEFIDKHFGELASQDPVERPVSVDEMMKGQEVPSFIANMVKR